MGLVLILEKLTLQVRDLIFGGTGLVQIGFDLMAEIFREQYGHEPRIAALHGGLECGILSGKLPELDCVSLGPDLTDIHTPRERLHIASTQRTWKLVLETLKRLK